MYVQGFLLAVPSENRERYRKMAAEAGEYFQSLGAIEIAENWEVDVQDGKQTDFRMATKAKPGEDIVFSWVIWPDKATCDAASRRMEEEMGEPPDPMPFDGMRMMWGGFEPVYTMGRDD
jgi:uncharacterized protein YbaA (DUF1428 family)